MRYSASSQFDCAARVRIYRRTTALSSNENLGQRTSQRPGQFSVTPWARPRRLLQDAHPHLAWPSPQMKCGPFVYVTGQPLAASPASTCWRVWGVAFQSSRPNEMMDVFARNEAEFRSSTWKECPVLVVLI